LPQLIETPVTPVIIPQCSKYGIYIRRGPLKVTGGPNVSVHRKVKAPPEGSKLPLPSN